MSRADRTAANVVFVFAARGTELLAGLIVVGLLSRHLGLEDFGRYSVLTAVGWVALPALSLGFPRILAREVARCKESAAEQILIGWSWNMATTLLLFAGLLLVSLFRKMDDVGLLLLVSLSAGFAAMTQTAGGLCVAFQRMRYETASSLAAMTTLLVLTAAAVGLKLGLEAVFAAQVLAGLVGLVLTIWTTSRLSPYLRELVGSIPKLRTAGELLKESLVIGMFQLLVQIYLYLGVFLLKALSGNAEAALFQAPFRIFTRAQIVPMTLLPVLLPIFSKLHAAGDADGLQQAAWSAFRIMLTTGLLLTFFAAALADQFMPLLLGSEFRDSARVFRILSLSISFSFLNTLFESLFVASKQTAALGWIQGAGVALCALLNLLLVPSCGALGSSWAAAASCGGMFAANWFMFRKLLPGMLTKTLLTAATGWVAGSLAAATEHGLLLSLTAGSAACIVVGLALGIVSAKDVGRIGQGLRNGKIIQQNDRQPSGEKK